MYGQLSPLAVSMHHACTAALMRVRPSMVLVSLHISTAMSLMVVSSLPACACIKR